MASGSRDIGPFGAQVARLLSDARNEAGLTLRALEEVVGVSNAQISRMLNGLKPMTVDEFSAICEALGLTPSAVLDEAQAALDGLTSADSAPLAPVTPLRPATAPSVPSPPALTKAAARTVHHRPQWDATRQWDGVGEEPQDHPHQERL